VIDFLLVRKVPLRRRGKFNDEGAECSLTEVANEEEAKEDPAVDTVLGLIRTHVLSDRDLNEKARTLLS
jgi:hypothetical protein